MTHKRKLRRGLGVVLILAVVIAGVLALRPVVHRLQDNADVSQVSSAFGELVNAADNFKSANPTRPIGLADIQNLLEQDPSLKSLHHPQTGKPYQVKGLERTAFISGPDSHYFLDYSKLDGTSFYFGSGSCSDPTDSQDSFLAYSIHMKRVGEDRGQCRNL